MRDEASLYAQRFNEAHVPLSILMYETASAISVSPLDPAFDRTVAMLETLIKSLVE